MRATRCLPLLLSAIAAMFALFATAAPTVCQDGGEKKPELRVPLPDDYQLPTVKNDEGVLVWDTYSANCPNCKGAKTTVCFNCVGLTRNTECLECNMTKETPCRVCAGEGMMPNPLEKAPCPGCMGAGMCPCGVCGGEGNYRIKGGSDKGVDCSACKGAGGYPCNVCRGARVVDAPKMKPSLAEASLDELTKAREILDAVLTAEDQWTPDGKETRKEIKNYAVMFKPAARYFPATRAMQKDFESMVKRVLMATNFESFNEMAEQSMNIYRRNNLYYLRHQKRLLDLAVARQEANQKAVEGKDGK